MINKELLDEYINKSGLKINFIAGQLGITVQSFGQKRNNLSSFKAAEIYVLCDLLNITDDKDKIFCPKGWKNIQRIQEGGTKVLEKFFEIYNIRFWLFAAELFYFPIGLMIGGLIYQWKHRNDEVQ